MSEIPNAVALYGTTEVEPPLRLLRAGPLTASFDRGGLRWVRWHDVEVVRGLSFLVRNADWGTLAAEVPGFDIEETADGFIVRYAGSVSDGTARLTFEAALEGRADGLSARVSVTPQTDFTTNRTGFVVLHPVNDFAGLPVTVIRGDGSAQETRIPEQIRPSEPVRNMKGLSYVPREGLSVEIRFEGEIFEMEDQRNWGDASFKTYSRPLDWQRPYVMKAGETIGQAVHIAIEAKGGAGASAGPDGAVTVRLGAAQADRLPEIALALASHEAGEAEGVAGTLRSAGLRHLLVRHDLSRAGAADLAAAGRIASALGATVAVDIIVTAEHDCRPEIAAVAKDLAAAGIDPVAVAAFPKADEISFQPGEPRPPVPLPDLLQLALRDAFPKARVGGGTPAYFTELNRKRPPVSDLDFVAHGFCPIVHAADDLSVIETLESIASITGSTQILSGARAYRFGPVGIGGRLNPYGRQLAANPDNRRVALAGVDPRQRGLFGAAWHVGLAAALAGRGVETLAAGAPTGPFALVHTRQAYVQPWFDEAVGTTVFPLFHALADLAAAGGKNRVEVEVSAPGRIAALAWRSGNGTGVLLANLGAAPLEIALQGGGDWKGRVLDAKVFETAAREPDRFRASDAAITSGRLTLGPYAVATLSGRGGAA